MLRFPWKQNQRLSCACLSVFLVIGHLSLFPFWTTSYLLTYPHTVQCAPGWMSRWCCSARGRGRAVLAYCFAMGVFLFLFFVGLFFSVITLALLYRYSEMMCTQYLMYSLSLPPSSGSICSLYILVVFLPFSFSSLLFVSYCAMVLDVVTFAPHICDSPPCSPVLYTLHNHLLVSLEGDLNSLSLFFFFPSHPHIALFLTPPTPTILSWLQSRSSLLFHILSFLQFQTLKVGEVALLACFCGFLTPLLLLLFHSFSLILTFFPHPFSPLSTHLPPSASFSPLSQWSH